METTLNAPLAGIRVLEISQWAAAPGAAAILADFGADVIKVEHPVKGDTWRGYIQTSMFPNKEKNQVFEQDNRNKRGMTLDLSVPEGRKVCHKLIERCDVLLTNMRPDELKKFELEYERLNRINPKLIWSSVTGYGLQGPESGKPGFDYTAFWARSGFQSVLREPDAPPTMPRAAMGDHTASLAVTCSIILALFVRERTGLGQEASASLLGTGAWCLSFDIMAALIQGFYPPLTRRSERRSMTNVYRTQDDRWIMLCHIAPDPYWLSFCKALRLDKIQADERFSTSASRRQHDRELLPLIEEIMARKTREEWMKIFDDCGLVYAPVQDPLDVSKDPQAWANDCFLTADHPVHGSFHWVNNPIRLGKTPAKIRRAAPEFNQHTEEVLLEEGFSWDEITGLKNKKVIA